MARYSEDRDLQRQAQRSFMCLSVRPFQNFPHTNSDQDVCLTQVRRASVCLEKGERFVSGFWPRGEEISRGDSDQTFTTARVDGT
ncbi:hypothetical protein RRG08_065636 [Elysia crispata]|uniref:Uncharacterized protein n=1 Tax=Elysia crispata TaxID=231223 RepID=A0AAE1D1Q0_9GAST|nr:hypothetical protein RRG08_065636 [Elysia crispata]